MPEKTSTAESVYDFNIKVRELEDGQLKDILKKRKLYQEAAAKAAIQEAINRSIISSEEDLYGPEYRHEPLKPKLFPKIENPVLKNKIRKSLSRGILLAGILPTIWGMVRLNAGYSAEGIVLISFGVLWIGVSAALIRSFSMTAVRFHFALAIMSVVYVVRWIILSSQIQYMDIFVITVIYVLLMYGLFFILRLRE
jgi:hypothetical protein